MRILKQYSVAYLMAFGLSCTIFGADTVSVAAFVPNYRQWDPWIRYAADFPNGRLILEGDGFRFLFWDLEDIPDHPGEMPESGFSVDCHSVKWRFLGAGAPVLIGNGIQSPYRNYIEGNDPSRWVGHVPQYNEVVYQQVYDGIHMRMYSQPGMFKYDWIVEPGADASRIKLEISGADAVQLTDAGTTDVHTKLLSIMDQVPIAWVEGTQGRTMVPCRFVLNGNVLSLAFPEGYDHNQRLVVDPTIVFSTFTGSTADNFGYTATYDPQGNFYAGGIVFDIGYPVTVGSFQVTFGGGSSGTPFGGPFDISLTKFNPTGTGLVYSTYLGGSDNEQPHSLVVDSKGRLCIFGRTLSTDFPISPGAFDGTNAGSWDLCISRLSADGSTLSGSTYVGGTIHDGVVVSTAGSATAYSSLKHNYGDDSRSDIIADPLNNLYIASCTYSSDFPTTSGTVQPSPAGNLDAVVFKLDSSFSSLAWSTYLGGTGNDAAYSIELDALNQVYVAGGTASTDMTVLSGSNAGGIDGFIAHLDAAATTVMNGIYIGTPDYNQVYFIERNAVGEIFCLGQTNGSFPISGSVYSVPNSGQFLQKYDSALTSMIWSTTVGTGSGAANISPTAFLVDSCQNIYISGWGSMLTSFAPLSTTGLPVTSDALQATTDGNDFYFMVLKRDAGALLYASFFGGVGINEHVDGGTSRFDPDNLTIYQAICGGCGGNDNMFTTPGAWSSTNNSFNCNLAAIKIKFDVRDIRADFAILPDDEGCEPLTCYFDNTSTPVSFYDWDFGDGGTSSATSPTHTFTVPGTYAVRLIAIEPNSCTRRDTVFRTVIVHPKPVAEAGPPVAVCAGVPDTLHASGGGTYHWFPSAGLSSISSPDPIVTPASTTTYFLEVINSFGCRDTDTVTVTVLPLPVADAGPDSTLCYGDSLRLQGSGGLFYAWDTDPSLSGLSVSDPMSNTLVSTTYFLNVFDTNGCTDRDSVRINVVPLAVAYAGGDTPRCANSTVTLTATGGQWYVWSTGDTSASIVVAPSTDTIYTVTAYNGHCKGTTDTVFVYIEYNLPVTDFEANTYEGIIALDVYFNNRCTNCISYEWDFGDGTTSGDFNPTHTYDSDTGYFWVRLITRSPAGCTDTMLKRIHVTGEYAIIVPNVFTPNGDGLNELFVTPWVGVKDYHMMIFDRWGKLVFESFDKNVYWDGMYNGEPRPEGVFTYKIEATGYLGTKTEKVGTVTLYR